MMDVAKFQSLMNRALPVRMDGHSLRVVTQCLYPSNSAVEVIIEPRGENFIVRDDAGARRAVFAAGARAFGSDRQLAAHVKRVGLKVERGQIFSPPVPAVGLPGAVMLVANASRDAAEAALHGIGRRSSQEFRDALAMLIQRQFGDSARAGVEIVGKSTASHRFGHVVQLAEGRRLLVDAVTNDPSSINARVISHWDVAQKNDPTLAQLIVFDQDHAWKSGDLSLLQMGAPIAPLSIAEETILRMAA